MKQANFVSFIDLEIGDVVLDRFNPHSPDYVIHDIRAVHYIREAKVEFEFQIKDINSQEISDEWVKREAISGPLNIQGNLK